MFKKLSFLALGCLATCLACELLLSFLPVASYLAPVSTSKSTPLWHPLPEQEVVFSRGWTFEQANRAKLNDLGYRSEANYLGSSGGTVLIGDSYIEAQMLPPKLTLSGHLQQRFAPAGVYALAVSGASLADYLPYAQWAAEHFAANEIVINLVGGDLAEAHTPYEGLHYLDSANGSFRIVQKPFVAKPAWQRELLSRSALMRYLKLNLGLVENFKLGKPPSKLGPTGRPTCNVSERDQESARFLVEGFASLRDQKGMRITFLLDPPRDVSGVLDAQSCVRDIDHFAAVARASGLTVLDLAASFRAEQARGHRIDFKPVDGHWNEHGHRAAANALMEWFARREPKVQQ